MKKVLLVGGCSFTANNFERKDITDRNGKLLATNIKVQSLYAHPSEIINKEKVDYSLFGKVL